MFTNLSPTDEDERIAVQGSIDLLAPFVHEGLLHSDMPAEEIIEATKSRLPVKDPAVFASSIRPKDLISKASSPFSTVDEFEDAKTGWLQYCSNGSSLATSLSKVAADVMEHMNTKAREIKREAARKEAAERQAALKRVREDAKATADEIRKKGRVQPETENLKILSADWSSVPEVPETVSAAAVNWAQPWVAKQSDDVKLCLGDVQLQKALGDFAMQCRKIKDQSGRHQHALSPGTVKEKADELLKPWLHPNPLDLTGVVDGGEKFMSSSWIYGFATDMTFVGLPPNGAAQVRVHATGTVECLLIDVESFVEFAKGAQPEKTLSLTQLNEDITGGTTESIQAWVQAGVKLWRLRLDKGYVFYMPTGVILVEKTPPNQAFIYGVRKSFLVEDAISKGPYSAVVALFSADSRNTERMSSIASHLEKSVSKAQAQGGAPGVKMQQAYCSPTKSSMTAQAPTGASPAKS